MEAGVEAEDCLYADLGIDPGEVGCQHCEASQFMFYRRRIDPSAYLVLWQVGVAGDRSVRRSSTGRAHRRLLVERLAEDYPADHVVTLYEAATLPIMAPRMERMRSEEHTSELQSLMRISYAVFCLKKKNITYTDDKYRISTTG